jgi:hypothetical protein
MQVASAPAVEKRIYVIRGRQVMLDEDLADLYGVETRVLVQQVKRNAKRFPADFMFQLTKPEAEALRSQIVISNVGRGGTPLRAIRLRGAGRGHALWRAAQRPGDCREHRDHAVVA